MCNEFKSKKDKSDKLVSQSFFKWTSLNIGIYFDKKETIVYNTSAYKFVTYVHYVNIYRSELVILWRYLF